MDSPGIAIPAGAARLRSAALEALADADNDLPMALRTRLGELLEEIAAHTAAMQRIEADLAEFEARDVRSQACAVANKLARRLWAAEHHRRSFDPSHVSEAPAMR